MSKDASFYTTLRQIFGEIFENKSLVIARRNGRKDFREVDYLLPEFSTVSEGRDVSISFIGNYKGNNLSERWEKVHRHEYLIFMGRELVAVVCRLPRREITFFDKPYNGEQRFVYNAIKSICSEFDNVLESFEPGLLGEYK